MHHRLYTKNWSLHVCSVHASQSFMSNCLITICTYEYWENKSPPIGRWGTYKVPRDLLLINNRHLLPCLHYTWYDTMIQLLGCSTQWVMKNIHHYISEYINVGTSINCSHMSHLPTSIIFWSTINLKKRYYNNIRFIVLQSIILSHQSLRILGPDPHLPQNNHC
jgi:hypothetical protein